MVLNIIKCVTPAKTGHIELVYIAKTQAVVLVLMRLTYTYTPSIHLSYVT
jgi:hypothetical protein